MQTLCTTYTYARTEQYFKLCNIYLQVPSQKGITFRYLLWRLYMDDRSGNKTQLNSLWEKEIWLLRHLRPPHITSPHARERETYTVVTSKYICPIHNNDNIPLLHIIITHRTCSDIRRIRSVGRAWGDNPM